MIFAQLPPEFPTWEHVTQAFLVVSLILFLLTVISERNDLRVKQAGRVTAAR